MKSKVKETKKVGKPFPKLMKSTKNSLMILAVNDTKDRLYGTVICSDEVYGIGYYCEIWSIDKFEDFEGEVILSND